MPSAWSYPGRELESMAFAVNYHRWILDIFEPYLGETVVEVGAGSGSFSELLLGTRLRRLTAIEPSANLFPLLRDHLRHVDARRMADPLQGTLTSCAARIPEAPDSILYVNVLEHVEDDAAELSLMRALLKPGGHALIFVPAIPALLGSMDRELGHFRRYTMGELRWRCRAAGFTIPLARHIDVLGIVPWWVKYRLLQSKTMEPAAVRFYDRWVIPFSRAIETRLPPPVGKNLLVVARKEQAR